MGAVTICICPVWSFLLPTAAHGGEFATASAQDRGIDQHSFVLPIIPDIQQYVWQAAWDDGAWYTQWPLACNLINDNGELPHTANQTLGDLQDMITHIANMDPPPHYVHQVGDLVEDHRDRPNNNPSDCEMQLADCMMRQLESAGVAWGVSVGNHEGCFRSRNSASDFDSFCPFTFDSDDYDLDDAVGELNEFFPRSRWDTMTSVTTGSYDPVDLDDSQSMMYSWHAFDAGNGITDNKWLVINIGWFECHEDTPSKVGSCDAFDPNNPAASLDIDEYYPITASVYERLNEVIQDHPDHSVVIGQHRLIQHNQWTPQGYLTYHNLVKDNPSVKLMLCGHHIESTHQHIVEHLDGPDGMRQVHVVMINYQHIGGGGDGYFFETMITNNGGGAEFRTYSPSLDQYADPAEHPQSSFDVSFGPVGDINLDGIVDSIDLQQVLSSIGPCVGCVEDIDLSGEVDVTDIQLVAGNCADCSLIDCNDNGVPDNVDMEQCDGSSWCDDCNGNNFPDGCDIDWELAQDCNANQIPDSCDIASDPDQDCNGNDQIDSCEIEDDGDQDSDGSGVLDECECLADVNSDCQVGVDDLLLIIGSWGSSDDESADINSDGIVGVDDLLLIMASWGACDDCP